MQIRWFVVVAVGAMASGCPTEEPAPTGTVIALGDNPAGTECGTSNPKWYVFTPATASVEIDASFTWRNDTAQTHTIETLAGTPLMTLAPGETGDFLTYETAGTYIHGVQGCFSHATSNVPPETSGRSNINVTVTFAP